MLSPASRSRPSARVNAPVDAPAGFLVWRRCIRVRPEATFLPRGQSVNYISTRGEAAGLGFEDVLLAGLARDGGLYVPEAWPKLSSATIASFAGRPFAELAVE